MAEQTVTHKDLAQALQVTETTIKSYRRKFPEFFPVHSLGKPIRFEPQALAVCRAIRDGFARGLSVEEARTRLAQAFPAVARPLPVQAASAVREEAPEAGQDLARAVDQLAGHLEQALRVQTETRQRLDQLHQLLADFLTLHVAREDAFALGVRELREAWSEQLRALAAAAPAGPEPDAAPSAKRVRIRNAYGDVHEYLLESAPAPQVQASGSGQEVAARAGNGQEAAADADRDAPPELRGLPLVIRTEEGDFLSVAGRAPGTFTAVDLIDLLARATPPPAEVGREWARAGEDWRFSVRYGPAEAPRRLDLIMRRVLTPRGNTVALVAGLEQDRSKVPAANLYALITQLRERHGTG